MKKGSGTLYFLLVLFLLIGLPRAAWAKPTISWSRESIARIMSPGFSGTETVTFESDTALSDVDLVVVPALQAYLSVSPAHFSVVKAQTPYSVTLSLQIPPDAQVNTLVEGTIHLVQGRKTIATPLQVSLRIDVDSVRQADPDKIVVDGNAVYPSNEVLLVLAPGTTLADAQQLASSFSGTVVGFIPSLNLYQVLTQTSTVSGLDALIQSLTSNAPSILVGVTKDYVPESPDTATIYTDLEHLDPTWPNLDPTGLAFAYTYVNTQRTWEILRRTNTSWKNDVVVGLVDSGVYGNHPEFAGVNFGSSSPVTDLEDLWRNKKGNPCRDDGTGCGHGTEVAGIIGANNWSDPNAANYVANYHTGQMNGILSGIPGFFDSVTRQTRYTLEERNYYASEGSTVSVQPLLWILGLIDELEPSNGNRAKVVLLEFYWTKDDFDSKTVELLIKEMKLFPDVLFVLPAGDSGIPLSTVTWDDTNNEVTGSCEEVPGCINLDNTITVGAFDPQHPENGPAGSDYGSAVEVSGPGAHIYAPEPPVLGNPPAGDNFSLYTDSFGATSGAAPFVAGTAALIWAVRPEIPSPKQLKDFIKNNADPIHSSLEIGNSLDICRALKGALSADGDPHDPAAPQLLFPDDNAVIPLNTSTASGPEYSILFKWTDVSADSCNLTGYDLELSHDNQVYWGTTTKPTVHDFNFLISNPPSPNEWKWTVTAVDKYGRRAQSTVRTFSFQSPVVGAPDLAIGMTASPNPVAGGGTLVYSITVQNIGSAAAANVVATDTLDSRVAFRSCSVSCSPSGSVVTVNLGTLAAGATITFAITVNTPAVGTSTDLTSVATVSTTGTEPNTGNNQVSLTTTVQPAQTVTVKVLHSFAGAPNDGGPRFGDLAMDADGSIYGIANTGGAYDYGAVYKLSTSGNETLLHSFVPGGGDGVDPRGSLLRDPAGNLYGVSLGGDFYIDPGNYGNYGAVFKLDAAGNETLLYSFKGSNGDGGLPVGGLIRDPAGNLYGATEIGGAYGDGTVFKVDNAGNETVLYSFAGGPTDGASPEARLVMDAGGNLYGTTTGGGAYGYGTVFKIDTNGKETVLHSFAGGLADGREPRASLALDAAGNLYGTTVLGGSTGCAGMGCGTVFKLATSGGESVIYSFTGGADGYYPTAGLIFDKAGSLYGVTQGGGEYGYGTVFKLGTGGTEIVLHSFAGPPSGGTEADGSTPLSGLTKDTAGNLYGTTVNGGTYGKGTVFELQILQ